jgi:hypothetical protein
MNRTIELAKKLKALADRGVDGEKMNAEKMLQDLMAKHSLTIEDIEGEKVDYEIFEYSQKKHQILRQIMYMVMGKGLNIFGYRGNRNALVIECTKSQVIEIKASFDFFWAAYERDLERFTDAFIHKNRLIPHDADQIDVSNLTENEIRELKKTMEMMTVIDRNTLHKSLESKTVS